MIELTHQVCSDTQGWGGGLSPGTGRGQEHMGYNKSTKKGRGPVTQTVGLNLALNVSARHANVGEI